MERNHFRGAGITMIFGAVIMLGGAVAWILSGADLDAALYQDGMAEYVAISQEAREWVFLNLSLWSIGVLLMGLAAFFVSHLSKGHFYYAVIARFAALISVPMALLSFLGMAAIVQRIAPEQTEWALLLSETLGWLCSRADGLATALIVGVVPFALSLADRKQWVPSWLRIWGWVCLLAAILTLIAIYAGGLTSYGFLIVPVGLGWMIAAGIVLSKKGAGTRIKVEVR